MSAFQPIVPLKAVEFVEAAGVGDGRRILADFAAAGLLKTYALSIETIEAGGRSSSIRGGAVSTRLWQRIIRQGAVDEVWGGGTVRLLGADTIGGEPEVHITGIGFSEKFLQRVVDHHRSDRVIKAPRLVMDTVGPPAFEGPRLAPRRPDLTAIPPSALMVTVKQAQAALGLGRTKINEMMNDGRLVRTKIDGAVRIEVAGLQALVAGSRTP